MRPASRSAQVLGSGIGSGAGSIAPTVVRLPPKVVPNVNTTSFTVVVPVMDALEIVNTAS
jgi:hypothetical protein